MRMEEGVEFEALQTRTVATAGGQMCANVCNANSIQRSHNGNFATFSTLFSKVRNELSCNICICTVTILGYIKVI